MLPHARCMAAYSAQQQHGVVWVVASSDDVHVWQGMMGQLDQAVEKAVGQKEKEMLQSRERLMREMESRTNAQRLDERHITLQMCMNCKGEP